MIRAKIVAASSFFFLFFLGILTSQRLLGQTDDEAFRRNPDRLSGSMNLLVDANNPDESLDSRKSVLLNGIDSEVVSILAELQREKNGRYNDLLKDILRETRNSSIAVKIYRLWEETSYESGLEIARNELLKLVDNFDFELTTIQAAISYLAEMKHSQDLLIEIANNQDSEIAGSAIRAIGVMGEIADTAKIEWLLERLRAEDPFAEEDLVATLIVALGNLRYEPAAGELVSIADDASAPAIHRRFACVSVGKIGRAEDYEIIEKIYYESDDANLRSYALSGLVEFPNRDITAVLIQALKRDSFWRIRVTAAERLADSDSTDISELLRYKIVNDPVKQVRVASIQTLGKSSKQKDWDFLIEYFTDNKNPSDIRLASLVALIENRVSGTKEAIFTIMDRLWMKDDERFLEFTCLDASKGEWPALAPVYERMLDHENWIIQVYGIRGIRRNNIASLMSRVNSLDNENTDERVLQEVKQGR